MSSPGGIPNALATTLHGSIRTVPSIHRLRLGLMGYIIPFAPLAFVSQCQCRPNRVLSPFVFFLISTHFTAPPKIPFTSTVLQLGSFHRLSRVEREGEREKEKGGLLKWGMGLVTVCHHRESSPETRLSSETAATISIVLGPVTAILVAGICFCSSVSEVCKKC
nr:reverse transcriptase domain-containing protein [Tanacetum cinerariifolium]